MNGMRGLRVDGVVPGFVRRSLRISLRRLACFTPTRLRQNAKLRADLLRVEEEAKVAARRAVEFQSSLADAEEHIDLLVAQVAQVCHLGHTWHVCCLCIFFFFF